MHSIMLTRRSHPALTMFLLAFATSDAWAASGNGVTFAGTAKAELLDTIALQHNGQLRFGTFFPGTGGTVVVAPDGTGTTTGGVLFWSGQPTKSDRFRVRGTANASYSITSGSGVVLSGHDSMAFTTLPSAATAVLDGAGNDTFDVGGTLAVPGGTHPGSYAGTYVVTVAYN